MRTLITLCSLTLLTANAVPSGCTAWTADKEDGHVKGQGDVVQRTLTVADFHGIRVEGSIDVELTPSETRSVVVEAQANIAELVTTEVKDGVWEIGTKEGYSTDKPFVVHISLPTIDMVAIEGSGDVKGRGLFHMEDMKLSTAGSGDITLEVAAQKVSASVAGSGDMKLSGSCTAVNVSVAGSGDVNARELKSTQANVQATGSGDVTVNASSEVDASVAGSGDVLYAGSPGKVHRAVSGSGDVRSLSGAGNGPR